MNEWKMRTEAIIIVADCNYVASTTELQDLEKEKKCSGCSLLKIIYFSVTSFSLSLFLVPHSVSGYFDAQNEWNY